MRNFIILSVLIGAICIGGVRNASCVNSEFKRDSLFVFLNKTDTTIQRKYSTGGIVNSFCLFYKDLVDKHNIESQKRDSIDKVLGFECWFDPLPISSLDFGVIESDTVKNISKYKYIYKDSLRKHKYYFGQVFFIEETENSDYIIYECSFMNI